MMTPGQPFTSRSIDANGLSSIRFLLVPELLDSAAKPEYLVTESEGNSSTLLEVKGFCCSNPETMNNSLDILKPLTVGELAKRTGVATSALRFYEERGLLRSERNDSGHRRYPRYVARRVAFIVFAQRVGLTLEEIRAELDKLPADRVPQREDWSRLSRTWSTRIDERIEELKRLKHGLTGCIGCGCLSLDSCAILNPDDRVASHGPGPRYWMGDPKPAG